MSDEISLNAVFCRSDDVLITTSQDMTVLMSMETSKFVELNRSGGMIWELTDGQRSVGQIVDQLRDKFAVSAEDCYADVTAFYGRLIDENLVSKAG